MFVDSRLRKFVLSGVIAASGALWGNGEKVLPPMMGWASWNTYRVNISEDLIKHQADLIKELKLDEYGYNYINIDDGWFGGRDENGKLIVHPARFPNGLKCVADYIHSLGLKAGIYSDAGANTCGSFYDKDESGIGVGLLGHEDEDCRFLFGTNSSQECGFDFIKVDFCGGVARSNFDKVNLDEKSRYTEIRLAMDKVRQGLGLNICRWDFPGTWADAIANSARMSHDISARWSSVSDIIAQDMYLGAYAKPGFYNDMDMLEIGRGLSEEEDHTQFAVWCFQSSPLMIGCDLERLKKKPKVFELLTKRDYIKLNQDIASPQGCVVNRQGARYILLRDIETPFGLKKAVLFVNLEDEDAEMRLDERDIGLENVEDCQAFIPAHGARIFFREGTRRLEQKRYEAENAFIPDYQEISDPERASTGYHKKVDSASCAMVAANCREIDFERVWSEEGGWYKLSLATIDESRDNDASEIELQVNCEIANLDSPIYLVKGVNKIRIFVRDGKLPFVDYMELEKIDTMQEIETMPAAARRGLRTFTDTVKLDVGNYDVKLKFGSVDKATESWVKFEGRRVALEKITTAPGEMKEVVFTARVKGPIAKKDEPTGEAPFPYSLNLTVLTTQEFFPKPQITPNPDSRTIYLCGDSTVTDQQGEPWGSWGQTLPLFFREGTAVSNFARSGLNTQSFLQQGRLDRILANLKANDIVLIQFGHNDQKNDRLAPNTGYKENIRYYIDKIREKGAFPVVISPMERLRFDSKTHAQQPKTLANYAAAAKEVANEKGVAFIDLNEASYNIYGVMGYKDSPKLFCTYSIEDQIRDFHGKTPNPGDGKGLRELKDKTHHSIFGAYILSRYIADELEKIFPELKDARREGYEKLDISLPPQDPEIPPSGFVDTTRPEGDVGNKE